MKKGKYVCKYILVALLLLGIGAYAIISIGTKVKLFTKLNRAEKYELTDVINSKIEGVLDNKKLVEIDEQKELSLTEAFEIPLMRELTGGFTYVFEIDGDNIRCLADSGDVIWIKEAVRNTSLDGEINIYNNTGDHKDDFLVTKSIVDNGKTYVIGYVPEHWDYYQPFSTTDFWKIRLIIAIVFIVITVVVEIIMIRMDENKIKFINTKKIFLNEVVAGFKTSIEKITQISLAFSEDTDDEFKKYNIKKIHSEVHKLNDKICSFIEYNKLTNAKKSPKTKFDLTKVLEEQIEYFSSQLSNKQVEKDIMQGVVVKANKAQAERVINNLISNAINYSGTSGKIEIKLSENNLMIVNSCDDISTIHEYARNKRKHVSNGLGLPIIEEICRLNGFSKKISVGMNFVYITIGF